MPFGAAPTDRQSSIAAMLERRASPRKRLARRGLIYLLTTIFWGVWTYLVIPIVSLILWFLGFQLFTRQMMGLGGYATLLASLRDYSLVLIGIVLVLALWIVWNVVRYGGEKDRRTVKAEKVSDSEIAEAHGMDVSLLDDLRSERCLRVDLAHSGAPMISGRGPHRKAVQGPPDESSSGAGPADSPRVADSAPEGD